jgi:hypothetical protein
VEEGGVIDDGEVREVNASLEVLGRAKRQSRAIASLDNSSAGGIIRGKGNVDNFDRSSSARLLPKGRKNFDNFKMKTKKQNL